MATGDRPTGTVTFVFTDIEGSTRMWEEHPESMRAALARHDHVMRSAFDGCGGYVFSTAGDAFAVAFSRPADAVEAATTALRLLSGSPWPAGLAINVRVGIHTGVAEERDGDYFGAALNRCARMMAAGRGGQVLLSNATAQLIGTDRLVDLGEHRLKDLTAPERIWQLGDARHAPLRTLDGARHNLPVQRTELFGRADDIVKVTDLLRRQRLVSLLGIGGTGKTRLAQATAAEIVDDFPDGVWFVDLVPVTDARRLIEAIADASGLAVVGTGDPLHLLCDRLRHRRMLLVLDNCEHIVGEVADAVDTLLTATQAPVVLTTSRDPLGLPDECQVHVPSLTVADRAEAPAVALFLAAANRVGATVGEAALGSVAQVCRCLDGLPLAIELAAAQLRQLTLGELIGRLDQRFELLERDQRGRGHRQASLLGVLLDTWQMLNEAEQELLRHLAAFPSTFDLAAVEAVTEGSDVGVAGRTLAGLVDRGLVTTDAAGRHRLMETVRLFARQQWPDAAVYPDRHAAWCLRHVRSVSTNELHTSWAVAAWTNERYDDLRSAEDHLVGARRWSDVVDLLYMQCSTQSTQTETRAASFIGRIERCLSAATISSAQEAMLLVAAAGAGVPARRPDWIARVDQHCVAAFSSPDHAVHRSHALLMSSYMVALRDTKQALELVTEATDLADSVGAGALANLCRAYGANHLAVAGRLTEAWAEIRALDARLPVGYDQAWHTRHLVVAAAAALTDAPAAVEALALERAAYADHGLVAPGYLLCLEACASAGAGDAERTQTLVDSAYDEARRALGEDGLPDLLLPAAILAWRRQHVERAQRWVTAIRRAGRPTANFLVTIMFRQLRDLVGYQQTDPLEHASLTELFEESRLWLSSVVARHD